MLSKESPNMKKNIVAAVVLALGLAGIAGTALAKGPGGLLGGRRMMRILEELNLTDQQEDMIAEIRRDMKEKRGVMKQARKETVEVALTELEKPSPDKARLHAIADQRIEDMRKMVHQGIDK